MAWKLITRFHSDRLDRGGFRRVVNTAVKNMDKHDQFRSDVPKSQRELAFGFDVDGNGEEYYFANWNGLDVVIVKYEGIYNVFRNE